ncbi:MAG: DNA repair protein RecO [Spirochaetes bacterium]|nr:DNA repair protein RecO [Spirochaetota bacterium]
MAERNTSFDALVLRTKESPSGDRIATFLGAEEGIVDTFIFGGAKSSLRSSASPFVHARVFIYTDPVKQYRKLSDMSILESFPGLRDSYERLMAASAISELLIRTSGCGGEYGPVFDLALRSLRLLDKANSSQTEFLLLAFLWKILDIMGLKPDLKLCSACGRPLGGEQGAGLRYSEFQGGFLCPRCSGETRELEAGAAFFLRSFSEEPMEAIPALAAKAPPPPSLSSFLRSLAQQAAEGSLNCLFSP